MEKGFAFLLSTIVLGGGALVVVACSEDESSTFPGESVDASTDGGPVFGGSSGNGSSSGAIGEGGTPGAKCEPVIKDDYAANWTAPTPPADGGPCSDAIIGTYYDECLGTLGKADHKTRCDAWTAANSACQACIEPTNNGGPIQWHRNRFYYTINVAGCVAVSQNAYTDNDCGYAYGAAVNCARDACIGCFETGKSTFADFTNCQNAAEGVGICASLQTQQKSKCTALSTTPETQGCFKGSGEDNKTFYSRVIKTFCGQ